MTVAQVDSLTPAEVELASERDGKRYELIDGDLKEKNAGFRELFVASRISGRLNTHFYPQEGAAAVEAMIYCFNRANHGRKPDVVYVNFQRLGISDVPQGDLHVAPDLVVEVLSPGNSGLELEDKLDEYLEAGVPMVWIVNPDKKAIRIYRNDGTTRLFRATQTIENESLLPGFRLIVGDVFPLAKA